MDFLEKDLEDIIYEADRDELEKRGLYLEGKIFRQKRIGNYGIADLITAKKIYTNPYGTKNPELVITVYELKKDKIDINAFLQAVVYARGIDNYLTDRNISKYSIRIVLIGKEISLKDGFCYLPDIFEDVYYYTYNYDIDGLSFNFEMGYKLIEEGF